MSEKVPGHIPRRHDDAPVSEELKRELDKQIWEAENDFVIDESAMGSFTVPDVGRSTVSGDTHARTDGVTTSPKIPLHDNLWTRLKNAHPYADSSDIEAMMEMVYGGQSVGEASRDGFSSYDPAIAAHLESLSEVEVENLLGTNIFADDSEDDGYDEPEEDDE